MIKNSVSMGKLKAAYAERVGVLVRIVNPFDSALVMLAGC
jgi:hypothetical protein